LYDAGDAWPADGETERDRRRGGGGVAERFGTELQQKQLHQLINTNTG